MERQGDEVHFETDEARGASSPNIVRWVLAISLFGAIVLMSVIWITGAATRDEGEKYVTVPETAASAAPAATASAGDAAPPAGAAAN
jgi:hypothetical protein